MIGQGSNKSHTKVHLDDAIRTPLENYDVVTGKLRLDSIQLVDSGQYMCRVQTAAGNSTSSTDIAVHGWLTCNCLFCRSAL